MPPGDTDFAYLCGADRGETAFLNQAEVRSALHVCSEAECGVFPGEHHWTEPYNYNKTQAEYHEANLYKDFIAHGLRIMIYSGDCDGCIPYSGTSVSTMRLRQSSTKHWVSFSAMLHIYTSTACNVADDCTCASSLSVSPPLPLSHSLCVSLLRAGVDLGAKSLNGGVLATMDTG